MLYDEIVKRLNSDDRFDLTEGSDTDVLFESFCEINLARPCLRWDKARTDIRVYKENSFGVQMVVEMIISKETQREYYGHHAKRMNVQVFHGWVSSIEKFNDILWSVGIVA